jgi:starch synthase
MDTEKLKIMLASSEMTPFAKTGGLADVISSLPKALNHLGNIDVITVLPKYSFIYDSAYYLKELPDTIKFTISGFPYEIKVKYLEFNGCKAYFLEHVGILTRNDIYGDDDGYRFGFFSRAVIELAKFLDFKPDVFHCHDWHVGMIPVYIKTLYRNDPFFKDTATVFTIHNLAYQGRFPKELLPFLEIGWEEFKVEKLEFWNEINFIKAGIVYSDIVNTVSKKYSEEIQTPEFGEGLDSVLRSRANDLYGIINGIDYDVWNPATDEKIPVKYDLSSIEGKVENKLALQRELGLPQDAQIPVIGFVSRLTSQKSPDLIVDAAHDIISSGAQLALLGTGEEHYKYLFRKLASDYPNNVASETSFNDSLARLIYAGSDMFLMPSRFEPCGLSQLISMRYGTIPVARRTGGLADTVHEYDPTTGRGTGFLFDDISSGALAWAVKRAVDVYHNDKPVWHVMVANAMESDFSWGNSAREYVDLYRKAIEKRNI